MYFYDSTYYTRDSNISNPSLKQADLYVLWALTPNTVRVSQVSAFTDDIYDQPQLNADQLANNVQQKVPNHCQTQPCVFHIYKIADLSVLKNKLLQLEK